MRLPGTPTFVEEANLMEKASGKPLPLHESTVTVEFAPCEIKTILASYKIAAREPNAGNSPSGAQ